MQSLLQSTSTTNQLNRKTADPLYYFEFSR